jgi:hypothetical protein
LLKKEKQVVSFVRGKIRCPPGCVPYKGENQVATEFLKTNVRKKKRKGCVTWVEDNWWPFGCNIYIYIYLRLCPLGRENQMAIQFSSQGNN